MSDKKFIYLAGPIAGKTVAEANDWRRDFSARLPKNIVGISPLRCEPDVNGKYKVVYKDPKFGTPKAIFAKNYFDTMLCDFVLVHIPEGAELSIGTIIELGWAIGKRKPTILVTTNKKLIEHPIVERGVDWIFDNFDDALEVIEGILGDYVK